MSLKQNTEKCPRKVHMTEFLRDYNLHMTNHVPLLLLEWIVFEVKEKIIRYHHGSADSKLHGVKIKVHPLPDWIGICPISFIRPYKKRTVSVACL